LASIWQERATDKEKHGTTIVLTAIRPQARDVLRSRDVWAAIEQNEDTASEEEKQAIEPPRFHIGRVDSSGKLLRRTGDKHSSLPWRKSDGSEKAFEKLVNLSSEVTVRDEMIEAMCRLLDAARYDIDEYRKWVKT
jgi:hypothetical protein